MKNIWDKIVDNEQEILQLRINKVLESGIKIDNGYKLSPRFYYINGEVKKYQ